MSSVCQCLCLCVICVCVCLYCTDCTHCTHSTDSARRQTVKREKLWTPHVAWTPPSLRLNHTVDLFFHRSLQFMPVTKVLPRERVVITFVFYRPEASPVTNQL